MTKHAFYYVKLFHHIDVLLCETLLFTQLFLMFGVHKIRRNANDANKYRTYKYLNKK